MKIYYSSLKIIIAVSIAVILLRLSFSVKLNQGQSAEEQTGNGMELHAPPFLKSAYAADSTQSDFDFLLDEAGVTAYTKLDEQFELEDMTGRFKTIRQQTDQFISGIVIAPGYENLPEFGENAELQVFLHRDGWIIAYLTRWQMASGLFDWVNYDEKRLGNSTLIENVVRLLALDIGASDFNISYYDFRHPEATNLMLVADHADDKIYWGTFIINIPRQLTIYESSWSSAQLGVNHNDNRGDLPGSCGLDNELLVTQNPVTNGVFGQENLQNLKFRQKKIIN